MASRGASQHSLNTSRVSRISRGAQSIKKSFNTSMAELNPNVTMESVKSEVRVFMAKRRISRLAWVSCILLSLGNVLTLITGLAPGWAWSHEINGEFATAGEYYGLYGIWYVCWDSVDGAGWRECNLLQRLVHYEPTSFFKSVQALHTLIILTGFISFVIMGAYMCVPTLNYSYRVLGGFIGASSMASLFNFALWVMYGATFLVRAFRCCDTTIVQREVLDYKLSYCFYLSVLSTVAFTGSAITAGSEITKMKRQRRLERKIRRGGLKHYEPQQMFLDPQTFVAYNNPLLFNSSQNF